MKTAVLLGVALVACLWVLTPAFAEGGDDSGAAPAAESTGVQAGQPDSGGDEETATCPNCGTRITIGRHGQAGQVMTCPECGREICPAKPEAEKVLCYGADMAFMSKYAIRGLVTTDGPVFEPNLWLSYKGFTVNTWMNMDLTDKNGLQGNFNELDFLIDYSNSIGKLSYSAGAVYYVFPHTGDNDTSEVYAGLGYDVILSPKLVVYYDFWQADGFYCTLSIGHSFGLPEVLEGHSASLDLSAQAGLGTKNFNEYNFGDSHTAFTDLVLTASLPVSLTDNITLKPTVSYSTVLDRTIRSKNSLNDNVIWGGVVSASF